jgi:hypothetical protein
VNDESRSNKSIESIQSANTTVILKRLDFDHEKDLTPFEVARRLHEGSYYKSDIMLYLSKR